MQKQAKCDATVCWEPGRWARWTASISCRLRRTASADCKLQSLQLSIAACHGSLMEIIWNDDRYASDDHIYDPWQTMSSMMGLVPPLRAAISRHAEAIADLPMSFFGLEGQSVLEVSAVTQLWGQHGAAALVRMTYLWQRRGLTWMYWCDILLIW